MENVVAALGVRLIVSPTAPLPALSRLKYSGSSNRHPGNEISRARANACHSSDCRSLRPCAPALMNSVPLPARSNSPARRFFFARRFSAFL